MTAAAAYAKASGDKQAMENARGIFGNCLGYASGKKKLASKFTNTRAIKRNWCADDHDEYSATIKRNDW